MDRLVAWVTACLSEADVGGLRGCKDRYLLLGQRKWVTCWSTVSAASSFTTPPASARLVFWKTLLCHHDCLQRPQKWLVTFSKLSRLIRLNYCHSYHCNHEHTLGNATNSHESLLKVVQIRRGSISESAHNIRTSHCSHWTLLTEIIHLFVRVFQKNDVTRPLKPIVACIYTTTKRKQVITYVLQTWCTTEYL